MDQTDLEKMTDDELEAEIARLENEIGGIGGEADNGADVELVERQIPQKAEQTERPEPTQKPKNGDAVPFDELVVDPSEMNDAAIESEIKRLEKEIVESERNPSGKPSVYGKIPEHLLKVEREDFDDNKKITGLGKGALNVQEQSGMAAADGGFDAFLQTLAYNSAGRVSAASTNKAQQMLARGYVDRAGGFATPLYQLSDDELNALVDEAGFNGARAWFGSYLGGILGRGENIFDDFDTTIGKNIKDPEERRARRIAYIQEIARGVIGQTEGMKRAARVENSARQENFGGSLVRGFVEQGAYTLPFVIPVAGPVVAGAIEANERYNDLRSDVLEYDKNGNLYTKDERAGIGESFLKSAARGVIAPTIEMVGGRAIHPIARQLNKLKFKGKRSAELFFKRANAFGRVTGMHSMPEEIVEEFEDQVIDAGLGLDKRSSEIEREGKNGFERMLEAGADFFKPENMKELATSMLLMQVIGGSAGRVIDKKASARIDKFLTNVARIDKEELSHYTYEEKRAAVGQWMNDLTDEQAEKMFGVSADVLGEITSKFIDGAKQFDFGENKKSADGKVEFKIPTVSFGEGEAQPLWKKQTDSAGNEFERLADEEHGVNVDLYKNEDGTERYVVSDSHGRVRTAGSFDEAKTYADDMADSSVVRNEKLKFIDYHSKNGMLRGVKRVVVGDSLRDVLNKFTPDEQKKIVGSKGYEDGGNTGFFFDVGGGNTGVAIVLDENANVEEMLKTIAHESAAHNGISELKNAGEKVDFINKLSRSGWNASDRKAFDAAVNAAADEMGVPRKGRKAADVLNDVLKNDGAAEELYAYITEQLHMASPTMMNRIVAAAREWYRGRFNADLRYDGNEIIKMISTAVDRSKIGGAENANVEYQPSVNTAEMDAENQREYEREEAEREKSEEEERKSNAELAESAQAAANAEELEERKNAMDKALEEAERKALEEAERKAKEEAERKAKEAKEASERFEEDAHYSEWLSKQPGRTDSESAYKEYRDIGKAIASRVKSLKSQHGRGASAVRLRSALRSLVEGEGAGMKWGNLGLGGDIDLDATLDALKKRGKLYDADGKMVLAPFNAIVGTAAGNSGVMHPMEKRVAKELRDFVQENYELHGQQRFARLSKSYGHLKQQQSDNAKKNLVNADYNKERKRLAEYAAAHPESKIAQWQGVGMFVPNEGDNAEITDWWNGTVGKGREKDTALAKFLTRGEERVGSNDGAGSDWVSEIPGLMDEDNNIDWGKVTRWLDGLVKEREKALNWSTDKEIADNAGTDYNLNAQDEQHEDYGTWRQYFDEKPSWWGKTPFDMTDDEIAQYRKFADEENARRDEEANANADWEFDPQAVQDDFYYRFRRKIKSAGKYAGELRALARGMKIGDMRAMVVGADLMAPLIPKNAVIVPMPNHEGKPIRTMLLGYCISGVRDDVDVVPALLVNPHDGSYHDKKIGKRPKLTMRRDWSAEIPKNRPVVVIDNVIASGATWDAASAVLPDADLVTLADASRGTRYDNESDIKNLADFLRHPEPPMSMDAFKEKYGSRNIDEGNPRTMFRRRSPRGDAIESNIRQMLKHPGVYNPDDSYHFAYSASQNEIALFHDNGDLTFDIITRAPLTESGIRKVENVANRFRTVRNGRAFDRRLQEARSAMRSNGWGGGDNTPYRQTAGGNGSLDVGQQDNGPEANRQEGNGTGESVIRWRRGISDRAIASLGPKFAEISQFFNESDGTPEARWRRAQKSATYLGNMTDYIRGQQETAFTDGDKRKAGAESIVYRTGDKVVKFRDADGMGEDAQRKIALHNELFPETPYTVIGTANDNEGGDARIVLEQPYVDAKPDSGTEARRQIVERLKERFGAENVTTSGDIEEKKLLRPSAWFAVDVKTDDGVYHVTDLKNLNVGVDADGVGKAWDAEISFEPKERGNSANNGGGAMFRRAQSQTAASPDEDAAYTAHQEALKRGDANERTTRLAPNGKRSNLTNALYHLVRTKRFKDWFGDWERAAEIKSFSDRITRWMTPENVEKARGKTRDEIFKEFGNDLEPIAYIPEGYLKYLDSTINDNRVYSGMGYMIDHAVNHHPEVDLAEYQGIQSVIDTADDVKLDDKNKGRNKSILFIKQVGKSGVVIVSFDEGENGKIVLHKSFFNKMKAGRFDKLPSIKLSSEVGNPSISHASEKAPAVRLSALEDGDIKPNIVRPVNGVSKVVDENGEPMVVSHASDATFNFFDMSKFGKHDWGFYGAGIYFSATSAHEKQYGKVNRHFFLNIKNPYDLTSDDGREDLNDYYDNIGKFKSYNEKLEYANSFMKRNVAKGYDGAIANYGIEYIAYAPSQIKSADAVTYDDAGNVIPLSQRFDESNPDIRFRRKAYKPDAQLRTLADVFGMTPQEVSDLNARAARLGIDRERNLGSEEADLVAAAENFGTLAKSLVGANSGKRWGKLRDRITRALQDYAIAIKRAEELVGLDPEHNDIGKSAYQDIRLACGRAEYRLLKLRNEYIKKYANEVARAGIGNEMSERNPAIKKIHELLLALHGPEFNRMISERTNGSNLEGSGRSTQYWLDTLREYGATGTDAEILAQIENGNVTFAPNSFGERALPAMKLAWGMGQFTRDLLEKSGRLSTAQKEVWEKYSRYYVPMRFDMDADKNYMERFLYGTEEEEPLYSKSYAQGESKHAFGHKDKIADDPVAFLVQQAETAILRSCDNETRTKLANIVKANPKLGRTMRVLGAEEIDSLVKEAGILDAKIRAGTATRTDIDRRNEIARQLSDQTKYVPRRNVLGENYKQTSVPDIAGMEQQDNVVAFKQDGELHFIVLGTEEKDAAGNFLNESNGGYLSMENAKLVGKAIKKSSVYRLGAVGRAVRWFSSRFGALRTAYSPEFLVSNFTADTEQAGRNLYSTFGGKAYGQFMKLRVSSVAAAARFLSGKGGTTALDNYAVEMAENGGMIGGFATENFKDIEKDIERDINKIIRGRGSIMDGIRAIADKCNAPVELSTRLAAYAVCRQNGYTPAQAASYARDVTVDFNRKGELTPLLNAIYVFSNANIQDMRRSGIAMFAAKKGLRMTIGLAVLGFVSSMLGFWQDEPEDEIEGNPSEKNRTEWSKQNRISVRIGSVNVNVPIRGISRIPYYLGRKMHETMFGETSVGDAAKDLGAFVFNSAFEPMGDLGGSGWNAILPTITRPWVELAQNKSSFGSQIYREPIGSNAENQVRSEMGRGNTSSIAKGVATVLNYISGGNSRERGLVDLQPEKIAYVYNWLTGSAGSDIARAGSFVYDIAKGLSTGDFGASDVKNDPRNMRNIPFLRRLIGSMDVNSARFHEAQSKFNGISKRFDEAVEEDPEYADKLASKHEYLAKTPEARRWRGELEDLLKAQKNLMKMEMKSDGETRDALNKLRMKTQGLFLYRLEHAPGSDTEVERKVNVRKNNNVVNRIVRGRKIELKREEREKKRRRNPMMK